MSNDWWINSAIRKKLKAKQRKNVAKQKAATELAYKKAKIPGRAPNHWMNKASKIRALGRQLPKEIEHLAKRNSSESLFTLLNSLNRAAKEYYKVEHSSIRAETFRATQKKFVLQNLSNNNQVAGGKISGEKRRQARDRDAMLIIDKYMECNGYPSNVKPVAREVAKWYVEKIRGLRSLRAVTQKLQRAKVAS